LLLSTVGFAAESNPKNQPDDPALPRVLIIGDSISIGYTDPVRELLHGKANVHRIAENGGPTSNGVKKIDQWLGGKDAKWNVIFFNFGLHDIKIEKDTHQVEPEQYEKNLREIVEKMKKTGAKLIWASTTPVPETSSPPRRKGDEIKYNEIAAKVMADNAVSIVDLYAAVLPKIEQLQLKANVHFSKEGYAFLGTKVAEGIEAALKK